MSRLVSILLAIGVLTSAQLDGQPPIRLKGTVKDSDGRRARAHAEALQGFRGEHLQQMSGFK